MNHNEKPDILSRIRNMKLRKEFTVLLAFFVMISTSYVMIHPGEALNNSTARSFIFFNEEEGMEETTAPTEVPDINALLDADRDSGVEEEVPAEENVSEEEQSVSETAESTYSTEPVQTPAETVVPTLEPTATPENTATAEAEGTSASTAMATAESESTSDPFSTASAEPEITGTPEATETPEATLTPEPSPSTTPEIEDEILYPAIDFGEITPLEEDGTETKEDIKVVIKAPEGAFPEGTTVKVVLVRDTEVLEAIEKAAVDATEDHVAVKQVQAVDITFTDKDGNEVQPAKPIAVSFKSELVKEAENTTVVHVEQDENKEKITDTKTVDTIAKPEDSDLVDSIEDNEVVIEADSFSVYGIVGTETITTEYISHNGTKYEVTVTYGPEAKIPEGSTLSVTDIEEGTDAYDYARNAVLADKKEKGEIVDIEDFNLAALDISIIDPDGNEIEPEATVQVDIKIKSLPEVEDLNEIKDTLEIQHHVEVSDGVVIEKVFDGAVEGAYKMDTDEKIAAEGTVVDPDSVSDEDFINTGVEDGNKSLDLSFNTEEFSTFTVTWRTGYNARTVTVHYVDESGNELTIANPNNTHPNLNANSSSPAFLIYDIDGYEYSYTYRNTNTNANRIIPLLDKNGSNYWRYRGTGNNASWTEMSNNDNIYVVYKTKESTQGGTPQVNPDDETWPDGNNAPQFSKSSTNNGNGTNTISLSIAAGEKQIENKTKANVIVVFDVSGSMSDPLSGNTSRLQAGKTAVNSLASTLLSKTDSNGNKLVNMALVEFSTTAGRRGTWTDNANTYAGNTYVGGMTASGGTNWEQALRLANNIENHDSDAATFIIFVTDGDPTYRVSRGDVTNSNLDMRTNDTYDRYRAYGIFGTGNSDQYDRNFDSAVEEVESIIANNKNFYAIGVSSDVTKVQTLCTDAGVSADHAFLATNTTALNEAFATIASSVSSTLGFGDVEITDGITELTNAEMKVMQTVDPDSFTYYRYGGEGNKYGADEAHKTEWTTREADGCAAATYDENDGAVHWDMGEGFQLESGVTYVVTFRVWASQEAYNLVAELNNGTKVYAEGQANSITAEERSQVVELAAPTATTQGSYALKTNTNEVNATYNKTTKTGDVVSVSDTHDIDATYTEGTIQNMALESMKLTVKKEFEDDLTAGEDRETQVTLVLKRRVANQETPGEFSDYAVPQANGTTSPNIVLNEGNNWTYSLYVAPGLKVDNEVLEDGYDFTIAEPGIDYHYDLIEEIINPMVVDGEDTYYGDGELLNGEAISEYTDRSLTAVNRVKSGIDVRKTTYEADGVTEIKPDDEFTIHGRLVDENGNGYTFNTAWDDRTDKSTGNGASADWLAHQNDTGAYHLYDQDGTRIGYKLHVADTGNFTLTLKGGQYVRFINVPEGSNFEFYEVTSSNPDTFELMSVTGATQHRTEPNGPYVSDGDVQPTISGGTVSLTTGVVGNKQYSVGINNKRTVELPDVELVKVDKQDNTQKLNGAEFKLYADAEKTTEITKDADGNALSITTGDKEGSTGPDGWYHIGKLNPGTYYLYETVAPTNHELNESPVIITVTMNSSTSTVSITATQDGTSVLTGPTDNVYTITVDNELSARWIQFKKVDQSSNASLGGAKFKLVYLDEEISLESNAPGTMDGDKNIGGLLQDSDGRNTFELIMTGGTTAYPLTETDPPTGYYPLGDVLYISVLPTGASAKLGDTSTIYFATGEGTADDPYVIEIPNSSGYALPSTGGPGTLLYTLSGLALILASAMMYGFRMRRRERRLN